ncbi:MAG: alpha/beta hydrolase [Vicinamibacterales bacterium]
MSENVRADVARRRVVYEVEGQDAVRVRHALTYRGSTGEPLSFDIYEPPGSGRGAWPVVLFVTGYNDLGMERLMGCKAKDMASYADWGRLVAMQGVAGVTYECREPAGDARAILRHVRECAAALDVDPARIGVWSCSGNVPNTLGLLMDEPDLACAALLYGYMLDLDGHAHVADAAARFRFVAPAAGRTVRDVPADLPLLIARAGRDEMPGLNDALDGFVAHALRENRPITLVNHHSGPHAFDIMDDSSGSREAVRAALGFVAARLGA